MILIPYWINIAKSLEFDFRPRWSSSQTPNPKRPQREFNVLFHKTTNFQVKFNLPRSSNTRVESLIRRPRSQNLLINKICFKEKVNRRFHKTQSLSLKLKSNSQAVGRDLWITYSSINFLEPQHLTANNTQNVTDVTIRSKALIFGPLPDLRYNFIILDWCTAIRPRQNVRAWLYCGAKWHFRFSGLALLWCKMTFQIFGLGLIEVQNDLPNIRAWPYCGANKLGLIAMHQCR